MAAALGDHRRHAGGRVIGAPSATIVGMLEGA